MFGDDDLDMTSPAQVAEAYGGDKRKIGQAVQIGLLDPTVGVMAGMFIDRMRAAALKEQQPDTTVAQDVIPSNAPAVGLAAAQPTPTVPQAPQQTIMAAGGGLMNLNVPDAMYDYAGGGIVAFAGPQGSLVEDIVDKETREIERGLRPDYSAEAKQILMQGSADRDSYLSREQQRLLGRSREIGRTSGAFAPVAPAAAPTPAPAVSPVVADRSYADESTRGTASYGRDSGVAAQLRDLQLATAKRDAEATAEQRAPTAKETTAAAPKGKEEPTEDALARRKRMLAEAGVSETPFAADRASLAELRGKAGSERDKLDALTMIQAGLGIAGGKSRYALQNLAGAQGAIESYAKGLRQLKEDEKEYAKIDRDLNKAEDALKRGDVDKALEFEDKAAQRQIQLRGVQAQERAALRPTSTAELLSALQSPDPKVRAAAESILGRGKTGAVDERFLREQWAKMSTIDKFNLSKQGITTLEQYLAANLPGAVAGGAGMGTDPLGLRGGR